MKLKVHEVAVNTAIVEVRTLTLNAKQVTLAVFRQLLEENLLNEDASFNGLPWGRVNYHPDRLCGDSSHMHIVWQKGDELRRATVYEYSWNAIITKLKSKQQSAIDAMAMLLAETTRPLFKRDGEWTPLKQVNGWHKVVFFQFPGYNLATSKEVGELVCQAWWGDDFKKPPEWDSVFEERCFSLEGVDTDNPSELWGYWMEKNAETSRVKEQWQRAWSELSSLPQLFIAI